MNSDNMFQTTLILKSLLMIHSPIMLLILRAIKIPKIASSVFFNNMILINAVANETITETAFINPIDFSLFNVLRFVFISKEYLHS